MPNSAPIAVPDAFTVLHDHTLNVPASSGVLANDTDADNDTLAAVVVNYPSHGYLMLNPDGSLTYFPNYQFVSDDSFSYQAFDGVGYGALCSDLAAVTIHVTDQPPVAQPDDYKIDTDQPLFVTGPGVLANDSEPDGEALSAVLVAAPTHGTVTLASDGSLFYFPLAGWSGEDTLSYTASDGALQSDPVTVTIHVGRPEAWDDSFYVKANDPSMSQALSGNVLDDAWAPEGGALTPELLSQPSHGDLQWNAEGDYIYTPEEGFLGTDTFTFKVSDGTFSSSAGTITLTVGDAAPQAAADRFWFHVGDSLVVDSPGLLMNDQDSDDPLTITAALQSGPSHGNLVLQPDGSFTYQPEGGFSGEDHFSYRAFDGVLFSDLADVTLFVEDQAPKGGIDDYYVWVDSSLAASDDSGILANDFDPDQDPLQAALVDQPQYAQSFSFNSDGSFFYAPISMAPPGVSEDSFTYRPFDGVLYGDPVAVTIHWTSVPVGHEDNYILDANQSIAVSAPQGLLANDFGATQALLIQGVDPGVGTLALGTDGAFTFVAGPDFTGEAAFTYAPGLPGLQGDAVVVALRSLQQHLYQQSLGLQSVEFVGTVGNVMRDGVGPLFNTPYASPQWLDLNANGDVDDEGDQSFPVAFTLDSRPGLFPIFAIKPDSLGLWDRLTDIRVRAIGPDGWIADAGPSGQPVRAFVRMGDGDPQLVTRGALVFATPWGRVDWRPEFATQYQISPDGGRTWITPYVSTSSDDVYVTWAQPRAGAPLFETSLFNACLGARGATLANSEQYVIDHVFAQFQGQDITKGDGTPLQYYGDWATQSGSVLSLLETGDGMCGAWSYFLVNMLNAIGVADVSEGNIANPKTKYANELMLINDWGFLIDPNLPGIALEEAPRTRADFGFGPLTPATAVNNLDYTYFNLPAATDRTRVEEGPNWFSFSRGSGNYVWGKGPTPGVEDLPGLPGQNTSNPFSIFSNHAFVKIGSRYYDPSYGVVYDSPDEFERVAIAGFMTEKELNEAEYQLDVNGDGEIEDQEVRVFLFRPNAPGQDLV